MKFKIEDNHLMIYKDSGALKEDATENGNECHYCKEDKRTCRGNHETRQNNGAFCDWMRCKYEEIA